jgi:hypothetical protein
MRRHRGKYIRQATHQSNNCYRRHNYYDYFGPGGRTLVQDRANADSDECVSTDLVASVATAFTDRDGIATARRTDAFFEPILSAQEHTPSVRSSFGNDYAISGKLLYKLPSGSTSKYNQARLRFSNSMVDSLFKHYHNSSLGGHFNDLRTHD